MHAWNPAQPNPQPCPTTHASPQLITQDVLGRAKKVLKTGQALSSTPAPAAQPMSIDVDGLRNSLRSELKAELSSAFATTGPAPAPAAPLPVTIPEGKTLVDSAVLLKMQLDQARAEERARLLKEGVPAKAGHVEVSLLAYLGHQHHQISTFMRSPACTGQVFWGVSPRPVGRKGCHGIFFLPYR